MSETNRTKAMGCPICQCGDVVYIEYEKDSVLLYECKNCKKFIMNTKTLEKLGPRTDFNEHRMEISAYIRLYFETCQRPIEIVLESERGISKHSKDIEKILDEIKNKTLFEIGCGEDVSKKGSTNVVFR
jgi:hypothetical protein